MSRNVIHVVEIDYQTGFALSAARRIVDGLKLWKTGKAGWDEISRSLLLYGPPGTGKTYLARAVGNGAGLSVVNASFGAWQSAGHLGDMLREMRATRHEIPTYSIMPSNRRQFSRNK
ncbi:AAA family ATPase [Falsihalocynthiibacter arcticus]|uniref:ATPase AAA-type core domain-containing protein n=1 Tax=Falsihalocynthiibacter arcticus TaxID=1579316 RepID=A0A126V0D8_9RHOB|nr:AAA family ATPase [Falsihalocynthiibacter arcticus]AML51798.1 hypothetical protein RC74_11435 [Falsihalocynthiibacter arcticus]